MWAAQESSKFYKIHVLALRPASISVPSIITQARWSPEVKFPSIIKVNFDNYRSFIQ